MKAIILAAGKSTRLYPLSLTKPKPLLKIANKTILEHNLEHLKGIIDEAIIVVGYKKEMIKDFLGYEFEGIKIKYVEQKEQLGTGHAVLCAKDYINDDEKFFIVPGDDMFSKVDINNCLKHDLCVLAKKADDPSKWGIIVKDTESNIIDIEEKPKEPKSNLANTAFWLMDKRIFKYIKRQEKTERFEIEITSALKEMIKETKVFCQDVKDYWLPIGYPWHILDANSFFLDRIKTNDIKGEIYENAVIKGKIIMEKGSQILPGVFIEGNVVIGKNTRIGPNCYIRGDTTIGDNCRVGQAVEIKNSVIGDNSNVPHLNYVGDSVIGDKCNLGAGTIIANLKHDKLNVMSMIKEKLEDTGRRKFGAVLADNVKTGINTAIYPGRKLWPDIYTHPGEIVKKDKINN